MMTKSKLKSLSAYLIHTRPYTDSRLLVDFFTLEYGRISAVLRVSKTQQRKMPPQLFAPMALHWYGEKELKTMLSYEATQSAFHLQGMALTCGLYLNELLMYLVQQEEADRHLFSAYEHTLARLVDPALLEPALREFEFILLDSIGYGIDFTADTTGIPLSDSSSVYYEYVSDTGFVPVSTKQSSSSLNISRLSFSGAELLAISNRDWLKNNCMLAAKKLARAALANRLGGKSLKSRELFIRM